MRRYGWLLGLALLVAACGPKAGTGSVQGSVLFDRERVEGTSPLVPATLAPGSYQWQVEAYDGKDHKLAIGPDTVRFTVAG